MRASDIAGMCLQNLKRRRARTVLTSLGVLVGTCSIVIMVSIGLGLSEQMSQTLAQMGYLSIIQVNAPYAYSSSDDGIKLNDEAVAQMAPSKRSASRRTRHRAPVRHARQSDAVLPSRHPLKGQQRTNQPKQVPEDEGCDMPARLSRALTRHMGSRRRRGIICPCLMRISASRGRRPAWDASGTKRRRGFPA